LATNQFEVGNPSLGVEEAVNLEATLRHRSGPFSGSVSAYTTWYDRFIFSQAIGSIEDGIPVFQYRAVDSRFAGIEVEEQWRIYERSDVNISVGGAFDFVRATGRLSNQPMPGTPPLEYVVGLDAGWKQLSARWELEGVVGQSRVAPQEISTGAYTFLNAKIAYEPSLFGDVRFVIRGRNLTNSEARPHTSFIKYVAPLPGRDVEFYVEATF